MLYNGDEPWTAPTTFEALVEQPELLGQSGVSFEYFKIAENEISRESLLKIRNIVSTLFLAETHLDVDVLGPELIALFDHESDKQAVSLFLNWFRQLKDHDRIDEADFNILSKVYSNREEVQSMLVTKLKKQRERLREEMREEVVQEVREEVVQEDRRLIARTMLDRGMDIF